MSDSKFEEIPESPTGSGDALSSFEDSQLKCIDCSEPFVWTAGEQAFFAEKGLANPPKRCKPCKKEKNRRLEAIEAARACGKRHMIEVRADCARCSVSTTIPFYPSQGRPVYCRACFLDLKSEIAAGANG